MANPYPKGSREAADFENGYQRAQSENHMQLAAATPAQIQTWHNNPRPWKEGFAAAAKTMGLSIIGDQLLQQKTASIHEDTVVHSYIPHEAIESVRQHGLMGSVELAKHKQLLNLARSGDEQKEWLSKLEVEKNDPNRQGPNAMFAPFTKDFRPQPNHPLNKFKLAPVKIRLGQLMRDMPSTKLFGMELVPINLLAPDLTDEQWENLPQHHKDALTQTRRHFLTPEEFRHFHSQGALLEKRYSDPENKGYYAADVPHFSINTPTGKVDPKYLDFEEFQKTADLTALPHQENLAKKLESSPGQIAWHGLGSGKSFSSIHSARKLKLPILAVVPAALRNNYRKELHAANFEHPSKVVSYQEAMNKAHDPAFQNFARKSLVVFDEAHRMGQTTSARSDLSHTLPAKKKLLLTATPIRNSPEEIVPLVNSVSPHTFPDDPEEFKKKYIATREVPVGFWGRLKGLQPGHENYPINLQHFQKAVKGKVDFYHSADRSEYPSHDEKIVEVPMSDKQEAAYNFVMGKYPTFSYRVKHGLPLNRHPDQDFQAFMIGPRQVANHPAGFNSSATDKDAPKVHAMVNEIEHRYKRDKNFRGVSYSSFLDSGINPLSRELQRRKIPHQIFTGDINDKERQEIVKGYNSGKNPMLLISGAGAEGLDLKGTKLMQIMEPHWQDTLIDQVKGRAIRYKSHSHLPESERHVEVQRFHSVPKMSAWDRLLGRKRSKDQGVDEYIYDMAKKKSVLNNAFLNAMQPDAKLSSWTPVDNQRFPALLVDLDETLVTQGGAFTKELGRQRVLPNRIQVLQQFKSKGYKIIGVTNRALHEGEAWGPDDLMSLNKETLDLFPGLLDDIICCMFACEHQKPAPTMIWHAIAMNGLDVSNIVFVGDHDNDLRAAEAAGVPFYRANDFFGRGFDDLPEAKIADWTDERNRDVHALKHGPEFGGADNYLALEREMSLKPLQDAVRINRRCTTKFLSGGKEVTRCATGFHSPSTGLLHVKDDQTGKTVTLYRKPLK